MKCSSRNLNKYVGPHPHSFFQKYDKHDKEPDYWNIIRRSYADLMYFGDLRT